MNEIRTPYSDLVAGTVTAFDAASDAVTIETPGGVLFECALTPTTVAELLRNLGEPYHDATGSMREMLVPGRFLFAYGVLYPDGPGGGMRFEAKHVVFVGREAGDFSFEKQNWWIQQIVRLADFDLKTQFGDGPIDFRAFRTNISADGFKTANGRQETDTISRMVYGFASAYLLTGDDRYLEASEKGTEYLRKHLRFEDESEGICYWYHAIDVQADGTEKKIFASEFGDDYHAIPCYEQIYALAGPTQTYRITGDPAIRADIDRTIALFNRHFKDKGPNGGFYSHIDPVTLDPRAESLGQNRARKNWNSVGDHAPAYLINLWLATGADEHAKFLEYTFDTICERFPDYDNSPFVQEKFHDDWSKDQSWGWQQNRAVVGHNLKIAWNLTRMFGLAPKKTYRDLAEKIGRLIPDSGADRQRGGWYDVVERTRLPDHKFHRFAWHDRKAWWQQEQGILAYYIMAGVYGDAEFVKSAREGTAFYNAWFLDVEEGGVYFNVLANGLPYALGTERNKGSHSTGYHSAELCYLAAAYINLLVKKEPMDFYFKPGPGAFREQGLRVAPDILPKGSVRIEAAWINGRPHEDFDADALVVRLPESASPLKVRVRLAPAGKGFDVDLMSEKDGAAVLALRGVLNPDDLPDLKKAVEQCHGLRRLTLDVSKLDSICGPALRYLAFYRQCAGDGFVLAFRGASGAVAKEIRGSELAEALS